MRFEREAVLLCIEPFPDGSRECDHLKDMTPEPIDDSQVIPIKMLNEEGELVDLQDGWVPELYYCFYVILTGDYGGEENPNFKETYFSDEYYKEWFANNPTVDGLKYVVQHKSSKHNPIRGPNVTSYVEFNGPVSSRKLRFNLWLNKPNQEFMTNTMVGDDLFGITPGYRTRLERDSGYNSSSIALDLVAWQAKKLGEDQEVFFRDAPTLYGVPPPEIIFTERLIYAVFNRIAIETQGVAQNTVDGPIVPYRISSVYEMFERFHRSLNLYKHDRIPAVE